MPFIGEVKAFAGNFAPTNWLRCDGQLLPIASYLDLYQVIGTTYGGDGVSTFALPDLRGRVPVGIGQGPGLTARSLGQSGGAESVALTSAQIPSHTHALRAALSNGTSPKAVGNVMARSAANIPHYAAAADVDLAPGAIGSAGAGTPHYNMYPSLVVTFIIAHTGTMPVYP